MVLSTPHITGWIDQQALQQIMKLSHSLATGIKALTTKLHVSQQHKPTVAQHTFLYVGAL